MDRAQLISKLQELNVSFDTVEHPAVMTAEAQVRRLPGGETCQHPPAFVVTSTASVPPLAGRRAEGCAVRDYKEPLPQGDGRHVRQLLQA